jgi:hypothetical protein
VYFASSLVGGAVADGLNGEPPRRAVGAADEAVDEEARGSGAAGAEVCSGDAAASGWPAAAATAGGRAGPGAGEDPNQRPIC